MDYAYFSEFAGYDNSSRINVDWTAPVRIDRLYDMGESISNVKNAVNKKLGRTRPKSGLLTVFQGVGAQKKMLPTAFNHPVVEMWKTPTPTLEQGENVITSCGSGACRNPRFSRHARHETPLFIHAHGRRVPLIDS